MKRVSSGVEGLDQVLDGGLPEGSVTLLTGGPGTGKTTFCCQFAAEALENGRDCVYISTEERPEDIKTDARQFGINFDELSGALRIPYILPSDDVEHEINQLLRGEDCDRVVLDSLSVLSMFYKDSGNTRMRLNNTINQLRKSDATVLVTAELGSQEGMLTREGVAEYIADGVIKMQGFALGESYLRSAQVVKMRRTQIDGDVLDVNINGNGLSVEKDEDF